MKIGVVFFQIFHMIRYKNRQKICKIKQNIVIDGKIKIEFNIGE